MLRVDAAQPRETVAVLRALACLCAVAAPALWAAGPLRVDARQALQDVRYFSSPELAGRGSGTPELEQAARYIAGKFAEAGVAPVPGSSYFQPFSITTEAALQPGTEVSVSQAGQLTRLSSDDYLPFSFSGVQSVGGPVVFAGYGISAPECGYDDYANIDVRGKFVLILRHEPQEFDADSCFEGKVYSEHSQFPSKAINARRHGAIGILMVNDTENHWGSESFEAFVPLPAPGDAGVPYIQVKSSVIRPWLAAVGKQLEVLQRDIDKTVQPASFSFPSDISVSVDVRIDRKTRTVNNVVAYLPGRTSEYVVIGAHYDHLGDGAQYSLASEQRGTVHPGADDNASGAAGLLALARTLSKQPQPRRGVLFIAFASEEIGLLGSIHYVHNPLLPLRDVALMINLDMIGRMQDRRVIVGGAGSGEGLRSLVQDTARRARIDVDTSDRAVYGSSDHTTFRPRMIPVLFFFTGLHQDYHRPSDTWDKIDASNLADLLGLVASIVDEVSRRGDRPRFTRIPAKLPPVQAGDRGAKSPVNSALGSASPSR